jgi:hypothetical protein
VVIQPLDNLVYDSLTSKKEKEKGEEKISDVAVLFPILCDIGTMEIIHQGFSQIWLQVGKVKK